MDAALSSRFGGELTRKRHSQFHQAIALERGDDGIEQSRLVSCWVDFDKYIIDTQRLGLNDLARWVERTPLLPDDPGDWQTTMQLVHRGVRRFDATIKRHLGPRMDFTRTIVVFVTDQPVGRDDQRIIQKWESTGLPVHVIDAELMME